MEGQLAPFALYPPNPYNTLHLYTQPFMDQYHNSPLTNPNALFYEHDCKSNMYATSKAISPNTRGDLSPMHFKLLPNEFKISYDAHLFDKPVGLETDITIIFFKEDDLLMNTKDKVKIDKHNVENALYRIEQK